MTRAFVPKWYLWAESRIPSNRIAQTNLGNVEPISIGDEGLKGSSPILHFGVVAELASVGEPWDTAV